jgi:hypothetical protein
MRAAPAFGDCPFQAFRLRRRPHPAASRPPSPDEREKDPCSRYFFSAVHWSSQPSTSSCHCTEFWAFSTQ